MAELVPVESPAAIETVAALARDIWERHYTPIIGAAHVAYMLAKFQSPAAIAAQLAAGYAYYLVRDGGAAVGYCALVPDPVARRMQLSKIYVLPERQGRGLGRLIVAFAERACAAQGLGRLWLTVNKRNDRSIAFYRSRGFEQEGAAVTDIGDGFVMDDYILSKAVAPAAAAAEGSGT